MEIDRKHINYKKRFALILLVLLITLCVLICMVQLYCKHHQKSFIEIIHPEWYEDINKFPKKNFVCKKNCEEYEKIIKNGYNKMKHVKIVFCGLCINIEKRVDSLKKRFEYLGSYFGDYRVVIFENDSTDNTRNLLKQVSKQNNKFVVIECPDAKDCKYNTTFAKHDGEISHGRMKKMATYRNKLLTYIKNNLNDFQVVCMIDLDIRGPIYIDGIAHSFGKYNKWDCVSANGLSGITLSCGIPLYYDRIAYKDDNLDGYNIYDLPFIHYKLKKNKIGSDLVKIQSGFAGMELIKMQVINNGVTYTPHNNIYICEHVIFHNNMRRKNFHNVYMNPNMIILVGMQGNENNMLYY